ncbi:MAG: hypothetical protein WC837_10940 [Bellilinea sp.]
MIKGQLSSKDWELLSSYMDGELNPRDKARVETRLSTQPEFLEALDGLRRTKAILRKAPIRKVPRNFTLRAADVQPAKTPRWIPTMQWSSAAVALVAVFLFAYQLVPGFRGLATTASEKAVDTEMGAPELAQPAQSLATVPAADQATPEVIYWGGPPAQANGLGGMGGGGGDGSVDCSLSGALCGGGAPELAIGGADQSGVATQMPFPQPPIPNMLPDLQTQPTEPARSAIAAEPVTGTGPILGVRPDADQGAVLPEAITPAESLMVSDETEPRSTGRLLLLAASILLALAVGLMIAAIFLKRKLLR